MSRLARGRPHRPIITGAVPASTAATTLTFTVSGGTSLSSLKGAVHSAVTPDLWGAPFKQFANETTDGSGVCAIDISGLGRTIGDLVSVVLTNSDGTSTAIGTQSATRRFFYIVGTCA